MKNYYRILGIRKSASADQIRLAYRALAKIHHPDRHPGNPEAGEKFKEISEAYTVLSDPDKRKKYDQKLYYAERQGSHAGTAFNSGSHQKNRERKKQTRRPPPPPKPPTFRERMTPYFFVGLLLFFFLLTAIMLIVGPLESEEEKKYKNLPKIIYPEKKDSVVSIYSADSPYDAVFSEGVFFENNNSIIITNTPHSEVVVCLKEANPPFRTIRNEYLAPGVVYRMNGVPNGKYLIKAYFGSEWDPELVLAGGKVKGGFKNADGFFEMKEPENLLDIRQQNSGLNIKYATYEVFLVNLHKQPGRSISEEAFFK